jgi:hypothetical protein
MTQRAYDVAGLVAGLLVAAVLLVTISVALLAPEATSAKVLIAVWLWSLPVIGVCTAAGLGLARLAGRLRGLR